MLFAKKVVALATVLALAALPAFAKPPHRAALPKKSVAVAKRTHVAEPDRNWLPDIEKAQKLLRDTHEAHYRTITDFDWVLAVACGPSLTEVVMKQDGSNPQGFKISKKVDHGISTRFTVSSPKGCIVLAQKRVINVPNGLAEAVYTAYAPELDTATMRAQGLDYLKSLQSDAFGLLTARGVASLAFPGAIVADKIPRQMALILAITEHIDPASLKYVTLAECIHEVLVTVAANREHAYEYAVSTIHKKGGTELPGARGLPQFMSATYGRVRTNYPGAALIPDFVDGMRDQVNAEAASILHFDLELTELPAGKRGWFVLPKNDLQAAPYFAAGYNWNAALVARAFEKYGHWTKHLPKETQKYVEIQSLVAHYLGIS